MLKKTGFLKRWVNGLVNPTDLRISFKIGLNYPGVHYVTMLKKTGFVERRVNGLVNPTDLRISFKIGLNYPGVPVYYYL